MIAIVANPNALRFNSNHLRLIKQKLESLGYKTDVFFTQKANDGENIVEAIKGRYEIIAAYGGDGIVNEIINGDIGDSALAVLPAGTTNVLAIELFGKASLDDAIDAIINGKIKKANIAKVNSRRFILMAGVGFDAESCFCVNEKVKKLLGKVGYIIAGVKAYLSSSDCFTIEIEGKNYEALWAIVSNAKKYAGNFDISKKTSIFDPFLDVFLCPCVNRTLALPYCSGVLFGGLHGFAPLVKHITTNVDIKISGTPHIQIDGDYFDKTNAVIKLDGQINIIVP